MPMPKTSKKTITSTDRTAPKDYVIPDPVSLMKCLVICHSDSMCISCNNIYVDILNYNIFYRTRKTVPHAVIRPFKMGDVRAKDSELRKAYVEAQALE